MRPKAVLASALDGSLEQLGIQRARFKALGPEQQRLALCEAVFAVVKDLSVGANWALGAAHFSAKKIDDFGLSEIRQHYLLLNALVALVCLGESAYAKPLVAYLSFPEPRWSLLIEPVLRAVSDAPLPSHGYRLRSSATLRRWREWATRLGPMPNLHVAELSVLDSGTQSWHVAFNDAVVDSLWLVSGHQWIEEQGHFFNADQARSCASEFYKFLDDRKFSEFFSALDGHLSGNDLLAYVSCDTFTACVRDRVNETGVRKELFSHWVEAVRARSIAPRTVVLLFQALKPARADRTFALQIVDWMVGETASEVERLAIVDVLRQRLSLQGSERVLMLLSQLSEATESARPVLLNLIPQCSRLVSLSLRRALTDDTHNLCLLANEDNQHRGGLGRTAARQRASLERHLQALASLNESDHEVPRLFALAAIEILEQRTPIGCASDDWLRQTHTYLGRWVAVLDEWLRRHHVAVLPKVRVTSEQKP